MHIPELALGRGRLRGLGGELRVGMHVIEREVAPDVAKVVVEGGEQLADDGLCLPAVWTLEVAVLDERHHRFLWPANPVALDVDGGGQLDVDGGG